MNIVLLKVLFGVLYGLAIGLVSLPISKKLILSRSEDPGDVIALRKKPTMLIVVSLSMLSSVGVLLTAKDNPTAIRNLVMLLPMLCIAIVDSLIRKIPNSLLLAMLITQSVYVAYSCITSKSVSTLVAAGIGLLFGFVGFTIPSWFRIPVGAGDVKYSAVIGFVLYIGCYLQSIMTVGVLVLLVFAYLKATKRGGMKTLIPMGPFLSVSSVISMCFPLLGSLVAVEDMF